MMSRTATRLLVTLATAAIAFGAYFVVVKSRVRKLTARELQGEWVQDRDFIQHADDLDAQRREVETWEDYEFAFAGTKLTGWRLVYSGTERDPNGWAKGTGVPFESEFTLANERDATVLRFTDHAKADCAAQVMWEGDKLAVTLGDRKFRLVKQPAEKLRIRKLVAGP
jgi:hypothetical protein